MPNNLATQQNTDRQLLRFGAATASYSRAKSVLALQICLTIGGGLAWSILASRFPVMAVWAAFYAFSVALLDALVLERYQTHLRKQGARIQELIDVELFGLPWRTMTVGEPPETEVMHDEGQRYFARHGDTKLKNWYPPIVATVPIALARLICQRANCWWDARLRQRYAIVLVSALATLTVIVVGVGIMHGMTLDRFVLATLAPLTPAYLWGVREWHKQREAADALDGLRKHVENTWQLALSTELSEDEILSISCAIQDGIFAARSQRPLIFNWIYRSFRERHEASMTVKAAELVAEATDCRRRESRVL